MSNLAAVKKEHPVQKLRADIRKLHPAVALHRPDRRAL